MPATLPAGLAGAGLSAAVLGIALAFVAWPWVRPDLLWNDIADAPNHLVRIFAVRHPGAGEAYPRWLGDLYLGYGYPLLKLLRPRAVLPGAALPGRAVGLRRPAVGEVLERRPGRRRGLRPRPGPHRADATRPGSGGGLLPLAVPLPDQPLRPRAVPEAWGWGSCPGCSWPAGSRSTAPEDEDGLDRGRRRPDRGAAADPQHLGPDRRGPAHECGSSPCPSSRAPLPRGPPAPPGRWLWGSA